MSNRTIPNYESGGPRPKNFTYDSRCISNQQGSLIPKDANVLWETVPMSPGNLRHLYSEQPFNYEEMNMSVPKGTLYDHDFSQTHPTGLGMNKIIGGGHYKVWPLTNVHVFEAKDYTVGYFRKPGYISSAFDHEFQTQPAHLRTNWS